MIVFLLLLLILAGLIYFYVRNKSGPDQSLKEGFEIKEDLDVSNYVYVKLGVFAVALGQNTGQKLETLGLYSENYTQIDYTTGDNTYSKKFKRVLNEYEINLVKRQFPNAVINAYNPIYRIAKSDFSSIGLYKYYRDIGITGQPGQTIINLNIKPNPDTEPNTAVPWESDKKYGGYTVIEYITHVVNTITFLFFPYIDVIGTAPATTRGILKSLDTASGSATATQYELAAYETARTADCRLIGNELAQKFRSDITIKDSSTPTFEITPLNLEGLDQTYPGRNITNKQYLSQVCLGTLINGSHTFKRVCNSRAETAFRTKFLKYGVALNIGNNTLFGGCIKGTDIPGLTTYGEIIPELGTPLGVSRELSNDGTITSYIITLPQDARYSIGGVFDDSPRNTAILYKIDLRIVNSGRERFTGSFEYVDLPETTQLTIPLKNGKFAINDTTKEISAGTYQETVGDVATFTISTYADKSVDGEYNYFNNNGISPPATTGTAGEGFLRSTRTYAIYRGTSGSTAADASANTINLQYNNTTKTIIDVRLQTRLGNQTITRQLGAGTYTIFINNQAITRKLTTTAPVTQLQIETKTGELSAGNAKITSQYLEERQDAQQITLQIRDESGDLIYYSSAQPFIIIGNRYPPTQAPPTSSTQECFLIQQVEQKGNTSASQLIDENIINDICELFDGRVATITDLQAELAAGADWCSDGLVQMTSTLTRIAYPVTTSAANQTCLPGQTAPLRTNGVIVVKDEPIKTNGLVCYGTKPTTDVIYKLTADNSKILFFKITPFNAFKKQWARKSVSENMEVFVVEAPQSITQRDDICRPFGAVRATKEQLIDMFKDTSNTADMTVPAYVSNDTVKSYVVINESAANSAISITGKPGVNATSQPTVQANYCYGMKPDSRTVQALAPGAAAGSTPVTYKIHDYNARRRVWSKYSDQPYKTYNLINRRQITAETNAYRKAALIVNDIQTSGVGAVRKPDSGNAYIGCDVESYGCKPAAAAERDSAPPQLVSQTKKFKVLDAATPINAADTTPEGINRAIAFVLACQKAGGAVPLRDDEYAGCEGPCCVPEQSANRLDASLFEEACEKPKDSIPVEECDADASATSLNQVSFEPYRFTRVSKAPTAVTKKATKCTNPTLSEELKKSLTQRFVKDIRDIARNEKLFNLRLPATQ